MGKKFVRHGIIAIVCACTITLSKCTDTVLPEQPNILFAIADDWSWPHAGIYGDPVVKTPAFDRIAREGILFEHAYVSSPSCTPSRNAILSGQYHWRLGPGANLWSTLDPATPVYPLLLHEAGYHVGSWRKSWGPGRLTGWEDHPAGEPYNGGFEEFLAGRPENTPFCFWLGSSDPHRPYERDSGEKSGMDLNAIKLFGCFPEDLTVRGDIADYYFEVQRFDSDLAEAIRILEQIGELENTIIVATGDNGMPFPRSKSNLYDSGVRVPLAIRWGTGIRHKGRRIEDFVSLTDLAPTFLEVAGVKIPDVMTGQSLIGIIKARKGGMVEPGKRAMVVFGKERHVPGQEDNLGGYPSRAIRSHDFLYIRNFKPDRWPSGTPDYQNAFLPGRWLADCDNGPTKTYMTENREKDAIHQNLWDLSFGLRSAEELYDCNKDPDQLVNLAADPEYSEIKKTLEGQLMEMLKQTADPRVTGGGDQFETYPYYGSGPKHPSFIEE